LVRLSGESELSGGILGNDTSRGPCFSVAK
jgi:hypothetical protein